MNIVKWILHIDGNTIKDHIFIEWSGDIVSTASSIVIDSTNPLAEIGALFLSSEESTEQ